MLSKINHSKPFVGFAVTLLFLISLACPAFAKDGTDGTELQVAQPEQLIIQLGPEWAGVEFQLKTDSGLYPGTIPVGEDGILRLEIGGSEAYTLICLESPVQAPAPLPTADPAQESAAQVSQPSEPTIESHSHEPEPEQDPNLAGIPIWQLCLFGGGMVVAIASSAASSAPTSKPIAKALQSPKVKTASNVVVEEESRDANEEAKNAPPPVEAKEAEKEPTSSSTGTSGSASAPPAATPAAVGTEAPWATPVTTPAPTPKPKEKVWVVDVPASTQQIWVDEQGHWEDKTYLTSDWVYQCNGCGQTFPSTAGVDAHQWAAFDNGEDHGGYTMVSGPMYEASEKVWVVDIEGHYETVTTQEQGHWEYQ